MTFTRLLPKLIIVILTLAACSAQHSVAPGDPELKPFSEGKALSPFTYLRKMSLHIRGQLPTQEEYANLTEAIGKNQEKEFLRQRLDAYLVSDQHIDKMSFRLEELFALKASTAPYYSPLISAPGNGSRYPLVSPVYPIRNSMNELFRQMVSRNLSWDTLLTGKNYKAFPMEDQNFGFMSDLLFYSDAAGTSETSDKAVPLGFSEDDSRVAGAITTGRFFSRYVNTAINKNRRRAAAVFRVFLCDDMKAVVVSEKGNQNEVLDKVFPGGGGNGGGTRTGSGDIHGSDKACLKCHYKLDPMGTTFQNSGLILSPLASPGALVFTSQRGDHVNVPVNGVGELAQAITQQDDYVRCQVQHFWSWFIGEDKPIDDALMSELASKFNEVRRRPNDFISYLVNRPEFGLAETQGANSALIGDVKTILKNCNGCHNLEGIPSFTDWPIGGTPVKHPQWLNAIRHSLSLDGSTKPRTMPPSKSKWQPTPQDLATLQKWFNLGAPNE